MNAIKSIVLLVASIVLALALAEFATRFALRGITTTANMQSYFGQRWKQREVQLNDLGFREKPVASSKPEGVYRIAILGDSFTFGDGIPVEHRYTNILQAQLNQSGGDFEVLNFGRPGASTREEIALLNEFIFPLSPDYILVQWLPNDFEDENFRWGVAANNLVGDRALHNKLFRNSALYFLLNNQWHAISREFDDDKITYTDKLLEPFQNPGSEEYRRALQPMRELLTVLKNSGTAYALLLHPLLRPDMHAMYDMQPLHDAVAGICRELEATCFDLTPAFQALGPEFSYEDLWVNRFDTHPNHFANDLVARQLLQKFGPGWRAASKGGARANTSPAGELSAQP